MVLHATHGVQLPLPCDRLHPLDPPLVEPVLQLHHIERAVAARHLAKRLVHGGSNLTIPEVNIFWLRLYELLHHAQPLLECEALIVIVEPFEEVERRRVVVDQHELNTSPELFHAPLDVLESNTRKVVTRMAAAHAEERHAFRCVPLRRAAVNPIIQLRDRDLPAFVVVDIVEYFVEQLSVVLQFVKQRAPAPARRATGRGRAAPKSQVAHHVMELVPADPGFALLAVGLAVGDDSAKVGDAKLVFEKTVAELRAQFLHVPCAQNPARRVKASSVTG